MSRARPGLLVMPMHTRERTRRAARGWTYLVVPLFGDALPDLRCAVEPLRAEVHLAILYVQPQTRHLPARRRR